MDPGLTPEAHHMLEVLMAARLGAWVDWRECVPAAQDPSHAVVVANQLRMRRYRIQHRGTGGEDAYRLMRVS